MALSVVDLYRDILPASNCGECGFPTCLAFAGRVVADRLDLEKCPHVAPERLEACRRELEEQYREGRWTRRDMAADALEWARKRSASVDFHDLPDRLGGRLVADGTTTLFELPYFNSFVLIGKDFIKKSDGSDLTRWEQVFIYNHLAQGGNQVPVGKWKGLVEFPNTVSKIKSMVEQVETPLIQRFRGKIDELKQAVAAIGGIDRTKDGETSGLTFYFQPLPRVPITLMFWDEDLEDGFEPMVKLLFDETVIEHLDIESILFLSERLRQLLCGQ